MLTCHQIDDFCEFAYRSDKSSRTADGFSTPSLDPWLQSSGCPEYRGTSAALVNMQPLGGWNVKLQENIGMLGGLSTLRRRMVLVMIRGGIHPNVSACRDNVPRHMLEVWQPLAQESNPSAAQRAFRTRQQIFGRWHYEVVGGRSANVGGCQNIHHRRQRVPWAWGVGGCP